MKRKKSKRKKASPTGPNPGPRQARPAERVGRDDSFAHRPDAAQEPTGTIRPATRTWLSLWLSFHLFAILVSFTSVVEPSAIHARLSRLVHPYLRPAHFAADDRPVYLAHGESSEQPHRLQVTTSAATDIASLDSGSWHSVGPNGRPGLAVSDRTGRWLSTAAMLAENEQPGLVAELLLPIAQNDPSVTAIRIVRFPTDLSDINEETESPYLALVKRDNNLVSLVQLKSARLSSHAAHPSTGSTQ